MKKILSVTAVVAVLFMIFAFSYAELNEKYEKLETEYGYAMETTRFFMEMKDPEHKAIDTQKIDESI